jgi:N-acetylglutamate synthase-like GNAT family acetyltransferase
MPAAPPTRYAALPEPFSEREFYLREFRGRTLGLAVPAEEREAFARIRPVLEDLRGGGSRVLLLSPDQAALEEHLEGCVISAQHPRLEGEVWRRLRSSPRLGIALFRGDPFAAGCRELAVRLGVFKLVWIDRRGGLRAASGARHSFLHLGELHSLLEAGGDGLASRDRLELWGEVTAMLEAGVPAVNICSADGLAEELFTYAGSGTLFTRDRYMIVRRLGIDDFDAAHDLICRGVEEGYLVERSGEEVDAILASGFGAFVEGRHLAGIGALLTGGEEGSGEIASLYTLTRFLGEGVGGSLVGFACSRARELGLSEVYACTTSERVGAFFERNGFREVAKEEIPESKWRSYDPERRSRVRCYLRRL